MKKQHLYYLLSAIMWIPFFVKGEKTSLVIIPENTIKKIYYWPVDREHLNFRTLADTAIRNTDSSFHIRYTADKAVLLKISTDKNHLFQIYLTNGSCDTIRIPDNRPLFGGTNKQYNECLAQINETENYCSAYNRNHELEAIDSLALFNQIAASKKSEIVRLLAKEKLSPEFIREQTIILDCMFTHLFYKKVLSLYKQQKLSQDWLEALKEKTRFDFQREETFSYSGYRQMLDLNIQINSFILNGDDPKNINRESICSYLTGGYKERITGKSLEYAWASLIYNSIFQLDYSKDIPVLYEQFCTSFPNSTFKKILEPGVKEIRRFHNKEVKDEHITIFSADSTLTNIEDAVKPFKGKIVYVDIWATWCGPCKKMFPYGDILKKATTDMNIVYLYISIDRPDERDKWEKTIYFYGLAGSHILAGKELAESLYNSLGNKGILSIPQFVIVGKDGKIAVEKAEAPDQLEKVIKQLKEVSNE